MQSTSFSFLHHHFPFFGGWGGSFFRLDCFGLPLGAAMVVFKVLPDGHNPTQDVFTSLGGVDLISNMQLNLDAGTHFNYWRGKIGVKPNIEGAGYFLGSWRLVVGRKRSRTELVVSASRASLLLHPNNSIYRCKWISINISLPYLKNKNKHACI